MKNHKQKKLQPMQKIFDLRGKSYNRCVKKLQRAKDKASTMGKKFNGGGKQSQPWKISYK